MQGNAEAQASTSLTTLATALDRVQDGARVILGGQAVDQAPMAAVRALARRGLRDLHLIAGPRTGLAADLLIGAGCVASIEFAQVVLDEFGLAPHFRRAAQEGRLECREHT